jgi:hypothetical protein
MLPFKINSKTFILSSPKSKYQTVGPCEILIYVLLNFEWNSSAVKQIVFKHQLISEH